MALGYRRRVYVVAFLLILQASSSFAILKAQDKMVDLYNMIYASIKGRPCVRLLDGTKQYGCSTTAKNAVTAALFPALTFDELNDFLTKPPSVSVILLLAQELLTADNINSLINTEKVAGLLVSGNTTRPAAESPEYPSPNKGFGLPNTENYEWNPTGTEMNYLEVPFPIWYVSTAAVAPLHKGALYNVERKGWYGQYNVEINSYMQAQKDSYTCFNKKNCQPLGGYNVISSYGSPDSAKPMVMGVAGWDTSGFFHEVSYGADGDFSGALALMGAATALQKVLDVIPTLPRQLVLAFFTGEAYGYIGSKAFLANIQAGSLPNITGLRNVANISAVVEAKQVAALAQDRQLFYFRNDATTSASLITTATSLAAGADITLSAAADVRLPPASTQSFIKASSSIPGLVFAEHNSVAYTNRFYHSIYDDINNFKVAGVCKTATFLARLLYATAAGTNTPPRLDSVVADCAVLEELAQCVLVNLQCSLVQRLTPNLVSPPEPLSLYTSVFGNLHPMAGILNSWMLNYTAAAGSTYESCSSSKTCSDGQVCSTFGCVRSNTFYTNALSPGITVNNVTRKYEIVDPTQPLWTESDWDAGIGIRMFVMTDYLFQVGILLLGLGLTFVTTLFGWLWRGYYNKHMKQL
mmetsp:Transcript_21372/g.35350  ORF Transcript_21372/g.35350 Transcript_21372/m.35350 type:complete len:638 (+) Transcript_21372:62-1975(+)